MTVKLDTEGIRYIGIFESLTGADVKDCILENDRVIMVVKKGDMGLAIGKGGANISKVKKLLKKEIEVIEHSTDVREFIANLLRPAKVKRVELSTTKDNKRYAYVEVPSKDKGIAIGKNGEKIKRVKILMKRNQDIDNVIIK